MGRGEEIFGYRDFRYCELGTSTLRLSKNWKMREEKGEKSTALSLPLA